MTSQNDSTVTYVTPKHVAKRLGVSERRVRQLLSAGRMEGIKQTNGRWQVYWPVKIKVGKRGPVIFNTAFKVTF